MHNCPVKTPKATIRCYTSLKYALLQLFPTGYGSGNRELASFTALTKEEAIAHFKTIYPEVNLDSDGYAKEGDISYCVAEYHEPAATNHRFNWKY